MFSVVANDIYSSKVTRVTVFSHSEKINHLKHESDTVLTSKKMILVFFCVCTMIQGLHVANFF